MRFWGPIQRKVIMKKDQCSPRGCRKQQEVKEQRQKEQRDQSRATRRWRWRWSRRRWRSSRSRKLWSRRWSRSTPRGTRVFPNARTHTCSKVGITGKAARTKTNLYLLTMIQKWRKASMWIFLWMNSMIVVLVIITCNNNDKIPLHFKKSSEHKTFYFLCHYSTNKYIQSLTFNFFHPPKNTPILSALNR